ncbi:MAG: hypothetical protein JSV84_16270 [Gemmatimonadota bacterium]|nr:MAG: hypothetical protein JSV84_16270 [Gemmatimonadota bacterium]
MKTKHIVLVLVTLMIIGCSTTQPIRWVSTPEYEVEYDLAWDLTIGLISEHFDIEAAEKRGGYLQTEWRIIDLSENDAEALEEVDKVGVRLTCRVEGRFPFQLKMKVERGLYRDGMWVPVWVDYSRESICQTCTGSQEWIDEELEKEILQKLSVRLTN